MDGIIVVAKPAGPTSHDVVGLIRRLTATRRVGHGGTLDPFASGVLPVFLGRATRLVEFHGASRKCYRATVCLGAVSTTDDLEGEIAVAGGPPIDRAAIERAILHLRGPIRQQPPAFSAIKVRGRRAYALARRGERPELPERDVTIHRLELTEWDGSDPDRPIAVVDVECSAGTYVRALARDLGRAVGSGAYLGALVRTASGPFLIEDAVTLDEVRAAVVDDPSGIVRLLRPPDAGLEDLPEVTLDPSSVEAIVRGRAVAASEGPRLEGPIRVRDGAGRLIAMALSSDGALRPTKVLVDVAGA
ncbi:MAG TPA: tRNA pseudouridine(55) synthase TruB [Candidatus Limnocylindrales bacterium]|nr:tRNA pseudouridine(55) synthase TruB [Candidatus Limnocylindrales bacterium]